MRFPARNALFVLPGLTGILRIWFLVLGIRGKPPGRNVFPWTAGPFPWVELPFCDQKGDLDRTPFLKGKSLSLKLSFFGEICREKSLFNVKGVFLDGIEFRREPYGFVQKHPFLSFGKIFRTSTFKIKFLWKIFSWFISLQVVGSTAERPSRQRKAGCHEGKSRPVNLKCSLKNFFIAHGAPRRLVPLGREL